MTSLDDADEYVQSWAIQMLTEDGHIPPKLTVKLAVMAASDTSPVVRLKLAASLQRLPSSERWATAQALLTHGGDADDHNIPKMIWFGIEPLVPEDPARALGLAAQSKLPLVTEFIARRAAEADAFAPLVAVLDSPTRPEILVTIMKGMRDGLTDGAT